MARHSRHSLDASLLAKHSTSLAANRLNLRQFADSYIVIFDILLLLLVLLLLMQAHHIFVIITEDERY